MNGIMIPSWLRIFSCRSTRFYSDQPIVRRKPHEDVEGEIVRVQLLVAYHGSGFSGFARLLNRSFMQDPHKFLLSAQPEQPEVPSILPSFLPSISPPPPPPTPVSPASPPTESSHFAWPSVQDSLEIALRLYLGDAYLPFSLEGSSRTDAGVHAEANSCHFDMFASRFHSEGQVVRALNQKLSLLAPPSIHRHLAVLSAQIRPFPQWHSRHQASARRYRYQMALLPPGRNMNPLARNSYWTPSQSSAQQHQPWRVDRVQEAAAMLVGTHDFTAFRGSGCQASSPVKTLSSVRVEVQSAPSWARVLLREEKREQQQQQQQHQMIIEQQLENEQQQKSIENLEKIEGTSRCLFVHFHFEGNSFLYNQVRNMMGALHQVGKSRLSLDAFRDLVENTYRIKYHAIAPPQGLFLEEVIYSEN